jgi:hypothetical protein
MASRTEQEAKGHLERQKITDEAEGKISFCLICRFEMVFV